MAAAPSLPAEVADPLALPQDEPGEADQDAATSTDERTGEGAVARSVKVPSPALLRLERRFAAFVVVAPSLGVAAALAYGVMTWTDLGLLLGFYLLTGFGITIGYHRLFTHGSFQCAPWLRATFAVLGSMALQGPVIRWVADHRRHHAFSDRQGDPHSPHLRPAAGVRGSLANLQHAHLGWLFDEEKTRLRRFAPDLLADEGIAAIDRKYVLWVALSFLLPAALGGLITLSLAGALSGFVFGGLVRIFLIHHITWSINSICHYFGTRPYVTSDQSTNNRWLALPSLGESWHNNHHAFPTAAVNGMDRLQLDPSGLVIRALAALGLAWDLKMPSAERRARRLRTA